MTDQQRGAYTPQQDVPLQFDARSPASRRPMPMALIASGTLLVVLIAAVAMYYSRGVRGDNEPPRPVGEPVAVLKSAPAAGAQPTDPSAALDVSAPQNVPGQNLGGKAPVFAAAPEAPKPRPAPAAPTKLTVQTLSAADMNKPEPALAAVAAAPVKTPAVKAPVVKTVATVATTVAPAPEVPAAPAVKAAVAKAVAVAKTAPPSPAKPVVATATKTAAPATGAATGARVQIGAFSSAALADKGYSDVSALLSASMSGKAKHVEPLDKDGATLYRTSVTGFSDRASATAFCEALKAKGKICFVKN